MRIKYLLNLNLILIFCICNLVTAYSDTIKIWSEQLNVSRDDNISIFSGDVYAEDGRIKLWSDKISIFYNESKNGIHEITAEHNVKIIAEGITAYGNYSKYQVDNDTLIIKGNVIVIEKDNKIQSDELILDLANSTSIMTSKTNNRVTAQISITNNGE